MLCEHYGLEKMLGVAQEECAELIQAISKYNRAFGGGCDTTVTEAEANVIEELADVGIIKDELSYFFNKASIDHIRRAKLARQISRAGLSSESGGGKKDEN